MVGSGLDFSNITRLGHGKMSQLEACVVSSTLLYGTTIKLKAGGGLNSASRHTALTGHTIAFANSSEVHWNPAVIFTLRPDFILAYLRLQVEVRRAESFVVHGEEADCVETGEILKFFESSHNVAAARTQLEGLPLRILEATIVCDVTNST
ncbi:hypothetical protein B484DRAFT_408427 [Ochromonadaceae sp. CCMP2298]|nr:hypothetical protein B484DRAFT_408427 [Ochromonadaceae sp. CCMP2298]